MCRNYLSEVTRLGSMRRHLKPLTLTDATYAPTDDPTPVADTVPPALADSIHTMAKQASIELMPVTTNCFL